MLKLLRRQGGRVLLCKVDLGPTRYALGNSEGGKKKGYFHWVFLVTFELNLEECSEFYHVISAREIHERDDLREDTAPTVEQI